MIKIYSHLVNLFFKCLIINMYINISLKNNAKTRSVNLHNMSVDDWLALQQHFTENLVTTENPTAKLEDSNSAVAPYKPVWNILNFKSTGTISTNIQCKLHHHHLSCGLPSLSGKGDY